MWKSSRCLNTFSRRCSIELFANLIKAFHKNVQLNQSCFVLFMVTALSSLLCCSCMDHSHNHSLRTHSTSLIVLNPYPFQGNHYMGYFLLRETKWVTKQSNWREKNLSLAFCNIYLYRGQWCFQLVYYCNN